MKENLPKKVIYSNLFVWKLDVKAPDVLLYRLISRPKTQNENKTGQTSSHYNHNQKQGQVSNYFSCEILKNTKLTLVEYKAGKLSIKKIHYVDKYTNCHKTARDYPNQYLRNNLRQPKERTVGLLSSRVRRWILIPKAL